MVDPRRQSSPEQRMATDRRGRNPEQHAASKRNPSPYPRANAASHASPKCQPETKPNGNASGKRHTCADCCTSSYRQPKPCCE